MHTNVETELRAVSDSTARVSTGSSMRVRIELLREPPRGQALLSLVAQ